MKSVKKMMNSRLHLLSSRNTTLMLIGLFAVASSSCSKPTSSKAPEPSPSQPKSSPDLKVKKPQLGLEQKEESLEARMRAEEQFKILQAQLKELEGKLSNVTSPSEKVEGEFVLPATLLEQTFLWTSSLQLLSTRNDEGIVEQQTSYVIGTKVAYFKRVAQQVLLVTKETSGFESDAQGEDVVARFEVVADSASGISLRAKNLGAKSAFQLGVKFAEGGNAYLRSLNFDAADNALIMEITFQDSQGSYYNVLEGVLPPANVVGQAAANAGVNTTVVGGAVEITVPEAGKENDRTHFPTLLSRLGVFPTSSWFAPTGEPASDLSNVVKTKRDFVAKFDISNGKTINWWVTSNIPETLLPEIKAGVEGWNRYFNDFRPANPVMVFRGKLPANVKVGDPRYNIIFFDAVSDAGSAYESQSVDPISGLQTHSLIYLPFAWYNISSLRWSENGDDSSSAKGALAKKGPFKWPQQSLVKAVELEKSPFERAMAMAKKNGLLKCEFPVNYKDAAFMVQSRSATTTDEAGRALVRSTLLHEVGHALGMAHNFKGTVTGDVRTYNETNWHYSSSTMDYNPFAMEDTLFAELGNPNRDVTKGLIQEYDRQFIDVVYNGGMGTIERKEAAFPYCDDAMHEDLTNGVDPFCRQYDFFGDVSQTIEVPAARLSATADFLPATQGGFITLQGLLNKQNADFEAEVNGLKPTKLTQSGPGAEELREVSARFREGALNAVSHLLISGSYSLQNALTRDMRLLGEWKPVDNIALGSEQSYLFGLENAAKFIVNLFSSEGIVNTASYKAHENFVQKKMAEQMAELFAVGLSADGKKFVGGRASSDLVRALEIVQQAQQKFNSFLLAKVSPSQSLQLQETLVLEEAQLNAGLNGLLSRAATRVANDLTTVVVVSSYTGVQASSRPAIAPANTQRLFQGIVKMAGRKSFSVHARAVAINWVLNLETWSSQFEVASNATQASAKTLRVKETNNLRQQLAAEKAPLFDRLLKGKYLSADERDLLEFLTQGLSALGEVEVLPAQL